MARHDSPEALMRRSLVKIAQELDRVRSSGQLRSGASDARYLEAIDNAHAALASGLGQSPGNQE